MVNYEGNHSKEKKKKMYTRSLSSTPPTIHLFCTVTATISPSSGRILTYNSILCIRNWIYYRMVRMHRRLFVVRAKYSAHDIILRPCIIGKKNHSKVDKNVPWIKNEKKYIKEVRIIWLIFFHVYIAHINENNKQDYPQ